MEGDRHRVGVPGRVGVNLHGPGIGTRLLGTTAVEGDPNLGALAGLQRQRIRGDVHPRNVAGRAGVVPRQYPRTLLPREPSGHAADDVHPARAAATVDRDRCVGNGLPGVGAGVVGVALVGHDTVGHAAVDPAGDDQPTVGRGVGRTPDASGQGRDRAPRVVDGVVDVGVVVHHIPLRVVTPSAVELVDDRAAGGPRDRHRIVGGHGPTVLGRVVDLYVGLAAVPGQGAVASGAAADDVQLAAEDGVAGRGERLGHAGAVAPAVRSRVVDLRRRRDPAAGIPSAGDVELVTDERPCGPLSRRLHLRDRRPPHGLRVVHVSGGDGAAFIQGAFEPADRVDLAVVDADSGVVEEVRQVGQLRPVAGGRRCHRVAIALCRGHFLRQGGRDEAGGGLHLLGDRGYGVRRCLRGLREGHAVARLVQRHRHRSGSVVGERHRSAAVLAHPGGGLQVLLVDREMAGAQADVAAGHPSLLDVHLLGGVGIGGVAGGECLLAGA